jgi:hypothetical protein
VEISIATRCGKDSDGREGGWRPVGAHSIGSSPDARRHQPARLVVRLSLDELAKAPGTVDEGLLGRQRDEVRGADHEHGQELREEGPRRRREPSSPHS